MSLRGMQSERPSVRNPYASRLERFSQDGLVDTAPAQVRDQGFQRPCFQACEIGA